MAKVLMAIATEGGINEVTSVTMAKLSQRPDAEFISAKGKPVDYVRNGLVKLFLTQQEFTHLFFVDSDMGLPLDCLDRLSALDVPLASGVYPVLMADSLCWAIANKDADRRYWLLERLPSMTEPFEADAGGAGCLLIRREVFDRVHWPWFKWVEKPDGSQTSEDIWFFRKANKAGLRVTVEPNVICNHFKTVNLTPLALKLQTIKESKR